MIPKFLTLIFSTFLLMTACLAQTPPTDEALQALVERTKAQLIFVEGGSFTMGDFGPLVTEDKQPFTIGTDNKHLHEVTLDAFSILSHRVTYADYALYTAANGLPGIAESYPDFSMYGGLSRIEGMPVGLNWPQARAYCQWLGELGGWPDMDLPTEAQWEYAARSRGQLLILATDNGQYEVGRNMPTYAQRKAYVEQFSNSLPPGIFPVGRFPPNPLGLYDMGFTMEWVKDWYDADYYKMSPPHNPQGPDSGEEKVLRGRPPDRIWVASTVERLKESLMNKSRYYWQTLFRCVDNSPAPVQ